MKDRAYVREAREVAALMEELVVVGDEPTQVPCEMVGAVDERSLGDQVAYLSRDEIKAVDDALALVLDLT
jgi:mRNA-degrading endonuclease toxin of MazEF toxin-antitoxin module